jgi:plasmid rolling circle replication initiator protein Rep
MTDTKKAVSPPTPIDKDTTTTNHSKKLERLANGKRQQQPIINHLLHLGKKEKKLARSISSCASYLAFRDYYTIGETRLVAANTCQKRFLCVPCEIRRGSKYVASYTKKFQQVTKENPDLKPYLITFTVKNGFDLLERHKHLKSAFTKLCQASANYKISPNRPYTEWSKIKGFVGSEEFTFSEKHGWHPHFHFCVLSDGEPDQSALKREWEKLTGDSFMVDVRPFSDGTDLVKSFCEVFKYSLKPSGLTPEQLYTTATSLKSQHLIRSGGLFYGVTIDPSDTDTIDDVTGLPYMEIVYQWIKGGYTAKPPIHHQPASQTHD